MFWPTDDYEFEWKLKEFHFNWGFHGLSFFGESQKIMRESNSLHIPKYPAFVKLNEQQSSLNSNNDR